MKLAVVGSRTYTDYKDFRTKLLSMVSYYFDSRKKRVAFSVDIITGGAKGADSLAELWAKGNQVSCKVIKPDYNKYGRGAPFVRNTEIAKECDEMVAFWDGHSKGTEDVLKKAVQFGKRVTIFGINNA